MALTILITSGPTREHLDPVRFLSNASSGRMGCALARAAKRMKHRVIFVSGPVEIPPPEGVRHVPVVTAREMFRKVKEHLPAADIVIGAAAVADYRAAAIKKDKMKKTAGPLFLRLVPNPDIIRYAGRNKGNRVVVGFALETRNLLRSACRKLAEKNLDLVVANGAEAIGNDRSSAWLVDRNNRTVSLDARDKNTLAERIIHEAIRIWKNRQTGKTVR